MITGTQIAEAARKYVGSPLQHQGRLSSLDCIGLVLAVAETFKLRDRAGALILRRDYLHYSMQQTGTLLEEECAKRLIELPAAGFGELRTGTVVTLRVVQLCHGGIISEVMGAPGLIHAHASAKKVAEHRIDDAWLRRITGAFRFPGVDY